MTGPVGRLLALPHTWCQEVYAVDGEGHSVDVLSPAAVAWCLFGALRHCYATDIALYDRQLARLQVVVYTRYGVRNVVEWQDMPSTTWEMVRAVLEESGV